MNKQSFILHATDAQRNIRNILFFFAAAYCFINAGMAVAQTAATKLTVSEGFVNPIGFYDAAPSFSWQLPQDSTVKQQSAYRIVVATAEVLLPDDADLWDSGKIESSQSLWIPYQGKKLQSRQQVYWQVRYWDQQGRSSGWSKPAQFELGLLNNTDFSGQWICMRQTSSAATPDVTIQIDKALYGVPGEAEKQSDVREKLRQLINKQNYVFMVSNDLAGSDPAYGIVKDLILNYRLDGKSIEQTLREGTYFNLATGTAGQSARQADYIPEYLRKEFVLPAKITTARLYVTAKGLYEVYLNGRRVGRDFMAPGWTPYHKRIETLTYDVTPYLLEGTNAIGAILGEGWYAGRLMRRKASYPEVKPQLLLQLEIKLADGQTLVLVTDDTWKATNEGPVRFSGIYDGEVYDARLEMNNWNRPGYDDQTWTHVQTEGITSDVLLVPKRHYPVRVTESLPTLEITEPQPGKYVFDLGQNMVGWPLLNIPVQEDKTITVRVAEMLQQDGTLYTENYRNAKSTDYYTGAVNGMVTWHPTFTFHGFRYVELSGFPEGIRPEKSWVAGKVLHSDFSRSGRFTSSHDKLNKLQRNVIWGQRGNYLDIPTDCPQRNERLGWTGDAQVFCPTSLFNYDVHSFWASWLQSVREEQREDGLIPHVVPNVLTGFGSPGWGDVGVVSPWDVYVRTGNREILEDNYDMMRRWTEAYAREAKDYIVHRKGYCDWLQPYPQNEDSRRADTPLEVIATAYFGRCTAIMEQVATILGRAKEAEQYKKQFANIRHAFSRAFFDQSGKLTTKIPTQTAYLMALGFNLLEPGQRDGAVRNLLDLIEAADGHLRTGFLGTPLITFVLDDCGHTDVAYQVLFKETYPSWFYSINQGATTMWERWNSYSHEHGFGDAAMNSFNHYAYGAIGQWMVERIAGLAPDPEHPGYKHFYIQPRPDGPLTSAEAELETPYGQAKSAWRQTGEHLTIEVTVPPNTTATLVVPRLGEGLPRVTESGKSCELIRQQDRFLYKLDPGQYVFKVE
jgi:alpha-L-rhamnosidase